MTTTENIDPKKICSKDKKSKNEDERPAYVSGGW